jgi:hypothetical protein
MIMQSHMNVIMAFPEVVSSNLTKCTIKSVIPMIQNDSELLIFLLPQPIKLLDKLVSRAYSETKDKEKS